jgi:hypothetical protein
LYNGSNWVGTLAIDATYLNGVKVSGSGPTTGQFLSYNGTEWGPLTLTGYETVTVAASGAATSDQTFDFIWYFDPTNNLQVVTVDWDDYLPGTLTAGYGINFTR